jgi:Flp pilus assembly protein TadB
MSEMSWVVPSVAIVAVFTLASVATWSESRRKEREAFHRHELFRRMLEQQSASVESVRDALVQLMREEEALRLRRQVDGERLGGLITTSVGITLAIFLYFIAPQRPVYLVAGIPFSVGLMLLVHSFMIPWQRPS